MNSQRKPPRLLLILGIFLLVAGPAACASADSEESEQETAEARQYESAQGENEDANAAGDGEEGSEQKKSNRSAKKETRRPGRAQGANQAGKGKKKEIPKATGPVAHVDGEPIAAEEFNDQIEKVAKTGKFPVQLLHRFKGRLIDRLIDKKLLDRAIESSSIEVSDEAVSKKLEEVRERFKKKAGAEGKQKSLDQMASKFGVSGDELRDSVRRSIAIEKLLMERGVEMPDDEETRKYYDDNQKEFEKPERVRARHIVAKVEPKAGDKKWKKAKKRIEKLRKKIVEEEADFATVAEENSDGPRRDKGGDLGYFSQKQMQNSTIAETAFSLEKDEVSEPVKSEYGWHLLKKVGYKKAETTPFEDVRERLKERLKNKRIKEEMQKFLKELREDAEIEKHPDKVE